MRSLADRDRYEETATAIVLVCRCKDLSDAETARSVIDNTAEALRTIAREAQIRVLDALKGDGTLAGFYTELIALRARLDSGEDL